jgi:DNA-binding transcriptional MerR regulator
VASLLKVEPHVLRYWESEFKSIRPVKSKSGHRVYARKDVETLAQVKHLLHEEKFSIQGAKKKLLENKKKSTPQSEGILNSKAQHTLKEIRDELKGLIQMMKNQAS